MLPFGTAFLTELSIWFDRRDVSKLPIRSRVGVNSLDPSAYPAFDNGVPATLDRPSISVIWAVHAPFRSYSGRPRARCAQRVR